MTFIKDDPENILSDKLNFEVTNKNGVIEKFSNISFNLSKDKQTYANWKSENLVAKDKYKGFMKILLALGLCKIIYAIIIEKDKNVL